MARSDGRIEKGQRISSAISARAWNRAQQAADIVLGVTPSMMAGEYSLAEKASNIVLVRNDSGVNVPMCGVLGINGVAIDPSNGTLDGTEAADKKAREFVRRPVFLGVAPTTQSHRERFCVAIEPIAVGAVGRAAIGGAFACRVFVISAYHEYAVCKNGDVTQLESASCGPVQLLWKQSGTGAGKWAVGVM